MDPNHWNQFPRQYGQLGGGSSSLTNNPHIPILEQPPSLAAASGG